MTTAAMTQAGWDSRHGEHNCCPQLPASPSERSLSLGTPGPSVFAITRPRRYSVRNQFAVRNTELMISDTTKLDRFAQEHDGDLDALSLDRAESLNNQLRKRNSFKRRGMDRRAAELKAEVADAIGADVDVSADDEGNDGPTTETLSASTIEAALGRILKCGLDMDALHSRASVEEHQQRLERKRRTCESRGMPNRAAELAEEIAVLEAAHDEARQATGRYSESDVETLAARVASEGYVLTTGPNGGLTARQTGGSE